MDGTSSPPLHKEIKKERLKEQSLKAVRSRACFFPHSKNDGVGIKSWEKVRGCRLLLYLADQVTFSSARKPNLFKKSGLPEHTYSQTDTRKQFFF